MPLQQSDLLTLDWSWNGEPLANIAAPGVDLSGLDWSWKGEPLVGPPVASGGVLWRMFLAM